jgi:hypothetical protein
MKQLMEYVRKQRKGQRVKVGVLLAQKVKVKGKGKRILIGWSKCKLTGKTPDKFDRERGLAIAGGRIQSRLEKQAKTKVPPSMKEQVKAFVERCKLYFETKEVKVV